MLSLLLVEAQSAADETAGLGWALLFLALATIDTADAGIAGSDTLSADFAAATATDGVVAAAAAAAGARALLLPWPNVDSADMGISGSQGWLSGLLFPPLPFFVAEDAGISGIGPI